MKNIKIDFNTRFVIKTTLDAEIPVCLMDKVDSFEFLTKKNRDYLLKLIAVVIHELDNPDTDPSSYYKRLSGKYIDEYIATEHFRENYFLRYFSGIEGNNNFYDAIFQTSGHYIRGKKSRNYRINPKYLDGPTKDVVIDVELECLNELFPDVVQHFNYSSTLIKPRISNEEMDKETKLQAQKLHIYMTGEKFGYYNSDSKLSGTPTAEEIRVPKKFLIEKFSEHMKNIHEAEDIVDLSNQKAGENIYIFLHERNADGRSKYSIVQKDAFLESKRNHFNKRINRNLNYAFKGKFSPRISSSNGRFNHLFTYTDNFCIDFFNLDNEPMVGYDLKCSQPTILANLLLDNPILKQSILSSKYQPLVEMLGRNEDVFFKEKDNAWFEKFLNCDIYKTVASENMERAYAKKQMMILLFTEPKAASPLKKPLKMHFPEFGNGLQSVKEKFYENYGTSKSTLPSFLQLVEAHIFVENIYQEIANARIPAISKHDSILCPASRLPEIKVIVQQCFDRIGFRGNMEEDVK